MSIDIEPNHIVLNNKIINITNPNKILFANSDISKGNIINYYMRIADLMLPYIKNRPLTVNGFSNDTNFDWFYRQHAPKHNPSWFKTIELQKKTGGTVNHILCQDKASLIYLINLNIVSIHRWLSTIIYPERPDILVVDIDPPKGKFYLACKAAKLFKEKLESIQYKTFVMTTGLKGLHIISKVKNDQNFEQVRLLLHNIASSIVNEFPQEFSVNLKKEMRKDLVYLDISRNAYGQTAIAPYSIRTKEGAPIATPLAWQELEDTTLCSSKYNINNIFDRLNNLSKDPWFKAYKE